MKTIEQLRQEFSTALAGLDCTVSIERSPTPGDWPFDFLRIDLADDALFKDVTDRLTPFRFEPLIAGLSIVGPKHAWQKGDPELGRYSEAFTPKTKSQHEEAPGVGIEAPNGASAWIIATEPDGHPDGMHLAVCVEGYWHTLCETKIPAKDVHQIFVPAGSEEDTSQYFQCGMCMEAGGLTDLVINDPDEEEDDDLPLIDENLLLSFLSNEDREQAVRDARLKRKTRFEVIYDADGTMESVRYKTLPALTPVP